MCNHISQSISCKCSHWMLARHPLFSSTPTLTIFHTVDFPSFVTASRPPQCYKSLVTGSFWVWEQTNKNLEGGAATELSRGEFGQLNFRFHHSLPRHSFIKNVLFTLLRLNQFSIWLFLNRRSPHPWIHDKPQRTLRSRFSFVLFELNKEGCRPADEINFNIFYWQSCCSSQEQYNWRIIKRSWAPFYPRRWISFSHLYRSRKRSFPATCVVGSSVGVYNGGDNVYWRIFHSKERLQENTNPSWIPPSTECVLTKDFEESLHNKIHTRIPLFALWVALAGPAVTNYYICTA